VKLLEIDSGMGFRVELKYHKLVVVLIQQDNARVLMIQLLLDDVPRDKIHCPILQLSLEHKLDRFELKMGLNVFSD